MTDARFFLPRGPFALGELATLADATLAGGDPGQKIHDVAPLDAAGQGQITFLDHRRYLPAARRTRAAACLIRPEQASQLPATVACLLTDQPYRGYARIAARFHPAAAAPCASHPPVAGIAQAAAIDPAARLGPGCRIAAGAVIEARAEIGPRCRIDANAVIGAGVVLGADCIVGPGASLSHCLVGARVVIHAGARIGQDGFGFALGGPSAGQAGPLAGPLPGPVPVPGPELLPKPVKVPQLGRVLIEDDVEIGANTTVDRGSGADTVIGRGCKIDNLVMIAHNVRLGPGCVVVAQSGISGSTHIGADSILAAQVGIVGHLTLGPQIRLAARSAVTRDLPGHETYGGAPAVPVRQWRRQMAAIGRLARKRGSA